MDVDPANPRKRSRYVSKGYAGDVLRTKRAQAISARINKRYPYKEYGRAYCKRGTPANISKWGETYKTADATQRALRKEYGYVGRGRYCGRGGFWDDLWGGIKTVAGDAYDMLGKKAIGKAGSMLGLGAYRGRGAYNSLVNPVAGDIGVARMSSSMDETGALTIRHREYIMDVQGTSSFQNNGLLVNPTNTQLFPFLAQFACNFDEYEFQQLIVTYRPVTSSLASASAQLGTVIMVADYNAGSSEIFSTKTQMMQYDGAVSARICDPIVFGVECDPKKNALAATLYVPPNGSTPAGEDPKTYNLALLQIATNQCAALGQIGELWVEYAVTLRKPKFCVAQGMNLPYSMMTFGSSTFDSPLGLGGTQIVAYPSGTNGNAQMTLNRTNLNNGAAVLFGSAFTTLRDIRAAVNTARGSLSDWVYGQLGLGGSSNANAYVMLPDTLGFGTYRWTLSFRPAPGYWVTSFLTSSSAGVEIVSTKGYNDVTVAGGVYNSCVVVFRVKASAVTQGIGGVGAPGSTTQDGNYIRLNTNWNSASVGAVQMVLYDWDVEQINPDFRMV